MAEAMSIRCRRCGMESFNATDIQLHFCGNCKAFLEAGEFVLDPLRDREELQKAHDLLMGISLGEFPNPFHPSYRLTLQAMLDVLCWVLRHDHNENFAKNLRSIDAALEEAGLVLRTDQERKH